MNAPDFLETPYGGSLAYHRTEAHGDGKDRPGVVFLGGFSSDMTGTKATWLEDWARARGRGFLRFDYRGHGQSSGRFEDHGIGDWAEDAGHALASLTEGPQVLVGSSMGGWISLLLARRMPERLAAFVGIAAAPDFTEDSMWAWMDEAQRDTLERVGQVALTSDYSEEPYVITRHLIEDGRMNLVLRDPLRLACPVRLLQGTADEDVSMEVALRLLDHLDGPDVRLMLVKGSDHRMSGERELALLGRTLEELS